MRDLYFYKASKWLIQDLVKEWSELRDASLIADGWKLMAESWWLQMKKGPKAPNNIIEFYTQAAWRCRFQQEIKRI